MKGGLSLINEGSVVLRATENFFFRGRRLGPYSQHRGLFVASRADALRLVNEGKAKLPAKAKRRQLIDCGSR